MRFSASMIAMWMECPLKAKFRYVDRLPTRTGSRQVFGLAVHAALDHYNQWGHVETAVDIFYDFWDNPEKLGVHGIDVWNKRSSFGGLRDHGAKLIREFHHRAQLEEREFIASEHAFLVPFGEHELTGFVDLLEVRKSGRGKNVLRIVDLKTKSKAPWADELKMNVQFSVYNFASLQPEVWMGVLGEEARFPGMPNGPELYERFKDVGRRGIWWHLMGDKELDVGPRDERDYEQVYRVCDQIQRALDAEVFVPRIGEDACGFCDFREPCGLPIPDPKLRERDTEWFVPEVDR